MASKDIRIRAVLDSGDFDNQIQQLQQRLQQMQKQSQQFASAQESFGSGKMGKYTEAFMGSFNKEQIGDLREAFNLNSRKLAHEERDLRNKQRELKKVSDIEGNITKAQKARVDGLKEEISLISKRGQAMMTAQTQIHNQAQSMGVDTSRWKGMDANGNQINQQNREEQNTSIFQALGGWQMAGGMVGAGVAGMGAGLSVAQHRVTRNTDFLSNVGRMQNMANQNLMYTMQGKGTLSAFEQPERQEAFQLAKKEMADRRQFDKFNLVFDGLKKIVVSGAAAAALAGSTTLNPYVAGVAGVGVGLHQAGSFFGNKDNWNMMFDRDAYEASLGSKFAGTYQRSLDSLKTKPRYQAQKAWSQQNQGIQGIERMMGSTTRELVGDPLYQSKLGARPVMESKNATTIGAGLGKPNIDLEQLENNADYNARVEKWESEKAADKKAAIDHGNSRQKGWMTEQQMENGKARYRWKRIEQNMSKILSSGGTGAFVKNDGANIAARFQSMGMTNASQGLGQLSGLGSFRGADSPEDAYLDIMAQGRMGGANTNEDSRRYQASALGILSQTGGATGAMGEFSSGIIGFGGREMQASMNAYQERNKMSGGGSGVKGALKWAFMNSEGKSDWEGVDHATKAWAVRSSFSDLNSESHMFKYVKQQMSKGGKQVTDKEVMERIKKVQKSGRYMRKDTVDAVKGMKTSYDEWRKEPGNENGNFNEWKDSQSGISSLGKYTTRYGIESGKNQGPMKELSMAFAESGIEGIGDLSKIRKGLKGEYSSRKGGTWGLSDSEQQEAGDASGEISKRGQISTHLKSFSTAAKKYSENTILLNTTMGNLHTSIKELNDILNKDGGKAPLDIEETLRKLKQGIDSATPNKGQKTTSGKTFKGYSGGY